MHKLWNRLQREEGFTLIELLVVIVIIGILLAIAVPSYLGFRIALRTRLPQANVRAAVPSAEAYYADNGNYAGMTAPLKTAYDSGLRHDWCTTRSRSPVHTATALLLPGSRQGCGHRRSTSPVPAARSPRSLL